MESDFKKKSVSFKWLTQPQFMKQATNSFHKVMLPFKAEVKKFKIYVNVVDREH